MSHPADRAFCLRVIIQNHLALRITVKFSFHSTTIIHTPNMTKLTQAIFGQENLNIFTFRTLEYFFVTHKIVPFDFHDISQATLLQCTELLNFMGI